MHRRATRATCRIVKHLLQQPWSVTPRLVHACVNAYTFASPPFRYSSHLTRARMIPCALLIDCSRLWLDTIWSASIDAWSLSISVYQFTMHLLLALVPLSSWLTGVIGEEFMEGSICVKNDERLTVEVKEELMIPTTPGKKYFCSEFKLTSTPEGVKLQAPLFGVTTSKPELVSFSGEPLDVINIEGLLTKSHHIVVNLSLQGVSDGQVEVMVWFDMKNSEERKALKKLIERHIRIDAMHRMVAGSLLL